MRVTKQLALNIATALTTEKRKEKNAKKKELEKTARQFAEKHIPDEVLKFKNKYPKLIHTSSGEQFNHTDLNFKRFYFDESIPNYIENYAPISNEDAKTLQRLSDEKIKLEKEYDELFREVEIALIGLKTFKNIRELFPEAAKFLPANTTSTALVVNLDSIRKKL